MIAQQYRDYHPQFDADTIKKAQAKIYFLRSIFFGVSFFLASLFAIFFIFLLFSFFRERRDVFRMIYIFGLTGIRARILTLAEPLSLLIVGSIVGSLSGVLIVAYLVEQGGSELMSR